MVCRCFQQWSVEHSNTRRPGSGRLRSTDKRQDGHIVWAAVAASREEIRAHVAPAVSLRTIGNRLLAAGLRLRVPLARLPLSYPGVGKESTGEWNEALLSSVMRVDYVCRQVMDVHVYGVDLVGTSSGVYSPRRTVPTSGFMVWRPSITIRGHIWRFCWVK